MKNSLARRLLSGALSIIMCFSLNLSALATENANSNANPKSVDDILSDYHERLLMSQINADSTAHSRSVDSPDQIKAQTMKELSDAGYEAYDVNATTFTQVEAALMTDLESMGLDSNGSYIIVVCGNEGDIRPANDLEIDGVITSTDIHTYNGVTYQLRYLKITGAAGNALLKNDVIDLLQSSCHEEIIAVLDGLIGAAISKVYPTFGTVLSLTTLSIDDFLPNRNTSLQMHCGTNWTYVYTQVWLDSYNLWINGVRTGYVTATATVTGLYYNEDANAYVAIPSNPATVRRYSDHSLKFNWIREHAVVGALYSNVYYDEVGDVSYLFNDEEVITHKEPFI